MLFFESLSSKSSPRKKQSNKKVSYDVLESRQLLAGVVINEFLAANGDGLVDDNGSTTDWIELYNDGPAVDLAGYSLTDNPGDPTKFVFPSQTLAANEYLVVFAGDDTDPTAGTDLFTGFGLSSAGEYAGLFDSSGTLLSEFAAGGADYPAQISDVSYGFLNDGSFDQPSYFATPTPGAANTNPVDGVVERVTASLTPGFYDTTQSVSLSTPTDGATIRYTTDGSTPSAINGFTYSGPISITGTTTLRAIGTKPSYLLVPDRTWSYLFIDDIVTQTSDSAPAGWPATWGNNDVEYGLESDVIAANGGLQELKDALLAIPTWSITTDLDNLFDADTGIYANAVEDGIEWERPASLEQLNPDGTEGFQVNAGIRIRGGVTRNPSFEKHALKFFFRSEYGDSSLEYDVFSGDPTATTSFEKIDLRTTRPSNSYIIDELSRHNQAALGVSATRSTWRHLYINGQYWGLYQPQERADANFGASYFGGVADDYDVIKPERTLALINEATDGNLDAYQDLHAQALARAADGVTPAFVDNAAYMRAQGLNPDGSDNPNYETLLDVDNLTAFMLVILHSGNDDGPINLGRFPYSDPISVARLNNYFALRSRTGDEGFRFYVHDNERTFRTNGANVDRNGPFNHPNFEDPSSIYFNPQWLHQQLMANADYRIAFADKVQAAFADGGPLSTAVFSARIDASSAFIDQAIIAESARWGSTNFLREDWLSAVSSLKNIALARESLVIGQFQNTTLELKDENGNYTVSVDAPLFPSIDAPEFLIDGSLQNGGDITAGASLSLSADSGVAYYTTDGSDPRLSGGAINPNAISYNSSTTTTTIFDRGSTWNYLDSGADLGGTGWQNSSFNDSSWESGVAELGYGDGEATTIGFGSDADNKNITTYFRTTFDVAADDFSSNYLAATLHLLRDDGAVVYLNGTEITRSNMPSGIINFDTPADSGVGGGDESTFFDIDLDPVLFNSLLILGNNTLAVEIHQINGGSSDLSFDAELEVTTQSTESGPLILNTSTNILARTFSNGEWSAINNATFAIPVSQSDLRISELHFNPADPSATEIAAGFDNNDDFEFIEIYNPSTTGTINLNGVQFSDGIAFEFGDTNLLPGERAVIVEDVDAFMERYGDSATVLGQWSGALNNGGEKVTLVDSSLDEIMSVDYGNNDPWHNAANGHGFSLVLNDPANTPVDELGKYYSWRSSTLFGGTPGETSVDRSGVVVNEVLAHTDAPQSDSIELFNPTSAAISVGGWYLSDEGDDLFKFQIPAATVIAAGGYLAFDESDFNVNATGFALSGSEGDQVYLSQNVAGFTLLQDAVEFDATFNGESLGRLPDGSGRLTRLAETSFGSANGEAEVGPLVISEVNYHPANPSAAALAIDSLDHRQRS